MKTGLGGGGKGEELIPCPPISIPEYATQALFHITICFFLASLLASREAVVMFLMVVLALAQSAWQVSSKPDPMTDKAEVRAVLRGDNAQIIFMCSIGTKPALIYQPDSFLGGGLSRYELRDFVTRFDGGQPQRQSWKYIDNYAAPYSTKAAVEFVTKLIQSKRLVVRALRYDYRTIDSSFDLAGSPQALSEAFRACGIR